MVKELRIVTSLRTQHGLVDLFPSALGCAKRTAKAMKKIADAERAEVLRIEHIKEAKRQAEIDRKFHESMLGFSGGIGAISQQQLAYGNLLAQLQQNANPRHYI